MPGTPSVRADAAAAEEAMRLHASCPPEEERGETWVAAVEDDGSEAVAGSQSATPTPPPDGQQMIKRVDGGQRASVEMLSPVSVEEKGEEKEQEAPVLRRSYAGSSPSMSYEFSNVRLKPSSPSSFLRSGSQFRGTQHSERQVYEVQVEIKHVDMRESSLCGYLRIQGLTEDHPTLTTYFEGEIIGSKYSFLTKHDDWGSTDKVDLEHWSKFQAFRPFSKAARRGNLHIPNLAQRENIFMRWKEHFLVPDHRVRTITGASFEGFYYICFNQRSGSVSGIYFHAKSEKFQQLELKHVPDRGTYGAIEFSPASSTTAPFPFPIKEFGGFGGANGEAGGL
ncbi:hypothetical protein VE03_06750 [Pseudogymnoascus sp. 23342-1-I1]|nr:hypothetical protein VE03_06750 [Pseudogymnoascus sp. 23342-1-I1]